MTRIGREVRTAALMLALGLGASAPAAAQQSEFLRIGAGFIGVGVSGIATGGLDDHLTARGYPAFGRTASAVSLGGYGILPGGLTLGGELHGLIIGDEDHDGRTVSLGGGYGTLGLGYLVELSPRTRIYPRIGIGGGGFGMSFESDSTVVDFDDALDDSEPEPLLRDPVLGKTSAVLDLGLGAELLPGGVGRGLMIGVRLGYLAVPFSSDWYLLDNEVRGGPDATIAGPYIRLLIGAAQRR